MILDAQTDISVIGEASDGWEVIRLVSEAQPDLVLMDVQMPNLDGLDATRRLLGGGADAPKILVLTTFDLDEYVYAALHAGASGFLVKDTSAADLLAAVRVVAAGEALLSPGVTRRLIAEFVARSPAASAASASAGSPAGPAARSRVWPSAPAAAPPALPAALTDREREVLTLIARGRSNAELAAELHLSPGTVKTHIGRLLSKLQARDRAQLVILAYETGLISPRS
jgi:DNA-binding NarL/FixJ family response regulator